MLDLFVATDAVRRQMTDSFEPKGPATPKNKPVPSRRRVARSSSAAALRRLADRLEPSPS
jgi:hypothetical protein